MSVMDGCERCHGANHKPFDRLRYVPKVRQWLCAVCATRQEEASDG